MRVAVFGGTGKTGWLVVRYAVDMGFGCKVLTRNPERMPAVPGVEYVEGTSINGGKVMLNLTGCDAVVVALRGGKDAPAEFLSKSISHIVSGMRKLEIERLLVFSVIGAGDSFSQVPVTRRLLLTGKNKRELQDLGKMENIVAESSLKWTIIRPAKLTDEEEKASYTVTTDSSLKAKSISREDAARFAVGEIEGENYLHLVASLSE